MGQGLSHSVTSSAVWSCDHSTHRCRRLWGPGHVCCRGNRGGSMSLISPPTLSPRTPACSPPTICQELTAAGGYAAGQTASPCTRQPRVFLRVPVEKAQRVLPQSLGWDIKFCPVPLWPLCEGPAVEATTNTVFPEVAAGPWDPVDTSGGRCGDQWGPDSPSEALSAPNSTERGLTRTGKSLEQTAIRQQGSHWQTLQE